jgi:hypothetical protein
MFKKGENPFAKGGKEDVGRGKGKRKKKGRGKGKRMMKGRE